MKHIIDKTKLADCIAKLSATVIMLEISVWLDPLALRYEYIRYLQQLTYVVTGVLAVFTLISLRKLIPKTLRRAIFDRFLLAVRKAASNISGISRKILSVFGIRFDRYKKRKDEKTFIFGMEDEESKKRRHSIKSSSKWKDMTENSEKIRFLYIKYIFKVIKGGYRFRTVLTPNEVRCDLKLEEEQAENQIFDLYNGARYSGGSVYITDEQVENVMALVNTKKK